MDLYYRNDNNQFLPRTVNDWLHADRADQDARSHSCSYRDLRHVLPRSLHGCGHIFTHGRYHGCWLCSVFMVAIYQGQYIPGKCSPSYVVACDGASFLDLGLLGTYDEAVREVKVLSAAFRI